MKGRWRVAGGILGGSFVLLGWILVSGWSGGTIKSAAAFDAVAVADPRPAFSVERRLDSISPAIPIYHGATYRRDLTEQDVELARQTLGSETEVYTLVTDDAFPMVWHYYVTYLAQFRGWKPVSALPDEDESWRSLELDLNEVMTDPFIPGASLELADERVTLQIVETEHSPRTVIRYIVVRPGTNAVVAEQPGVEAPVFAAE